MRAQRSGLIVTISSTAGIRGGEFLTAYAASKFGVEGWMESLAPEVAPFGIRTMLVEPGVVNEYLQISSDYDALSDEYVARIYNELEHKPLDREWLARFAATVGTSGPICDLGCGPGHVARYLHEQGVQVLGVDLSLRMIELARQLNSGIEFRVGNLAALEVADGS